jgi:hypothetical protein
MVCRAPSNFTFSSLGCCECACVREREQEVCSQGVVCYCIVSCYVAVFFLSHEIDLCGLFCNTINMFDFIALNSKMTHPCGGGVEYLHRDPASRRRRRKGKSQI